MFNFSLLPTSHKTSSLRYQVFAPSTTTHLKFEQVIGKVIWVSSPVKVHNISKCLRMVGWQWVFFFFFFFDCVSVCIDTMYTHVRTHTPTCTHTQSHTHTQTYTNVLGNIFTIFVAINMSSHKFMWKDYHICCFILHSHLTQSIHPSPYNQNNPATRSRIQETTLAHVSSLLSLSAPLAYKLTRGALYCDLNSRLGEGRKIERPQECFHSTSQWFCLFMPGRWHIVQKIVNKNGGQCC